MRFKVASGGSEEFSGSGVVLLDADALSGIGARPGDAVEISGRRKTVAFAESPSGGNLGLKVIRMDSVTRENAGVKVGQSVSVKKTTLKEAERIVLGPGKGLKRIQAPVHFLRKGFSRKAVLKGDQLTLASSRFTMDEVVYASDWEEGLFANLYEALMSVGFGRVRFAVLNTFPKGPVIITGFTEIALQESGKGYVPRAQAFVRDYARMLEAGITRKNPELKKLKRKISGLKVAVSKPVLEELELQKKRLLKKIAGLKK